MLFFFIIKNLFYNYSPILNIIFSNKVSANIKYLRIIPPNIYFIAFIHITYFFILTLPMYQTQNNQQYEKSYFIKRFTA